jgi:hypothetical protein
LCAPLKFRAEVNVDGILSSTLLLGGLLVGFLLWVALAKFSIRSIYGWVLIVIYAGYILAVVMKWI